MPSPIVNVLFDLDDTLTDPRAGIVACFKHALDGLGRCSRNRIFIPASARRCEKASRRF